jgi:cathepsin F
MKLLAVLLIVGVASAITMEDRFDSFMTTYQRRYYGAEYQYRLKVFAENVKLAEQRNLEDSAVHGVTQFSDLTVEEFRQKFLMKAEEGQKLAVACLQHGIYKKSTKGLVPPDSWDWRDHAGVVQPIGDQKSCGSCWAFSAAANIEGVLGVAGRNVGKMSPQYIVDCSKGSLH